MAVSLGNGNIGEMIALASDANHKPRLWLICHYNSSTYNRGTFGSGLSGDAFRDCMVVTPELLRFFPLLKPLPQASLEQLAPACSVQRLARRAVVLQAGLLEQQVCFLFEGRLQGVDFTVDGREVGLYFVEPGDFCGELSLFDYGPQPEFVIVLSPAVVVSVPVDSLRELMPEQPVIMQQLGMRLATRLRQMTQQRSLLGMPNISQRVCCQLWLLIPEQEHAAEHSEIRNPPTHLEIAIMLNLSRETVTRVFQQLQGQEVVRRDGSTRLLVPQLAKLKALAEGHAEL
jgi:CRP/FNR family cyclic AMP-dependent transcriptional regulator